MIKFSLINISLIILNILIGKELPYIFVTIELVICFILLIDFFNNLKEKNLRKKLFNTILFSTCIVITPSFIYGNLSYGQLLRASYFILIFQYIFVSIPSDIYKHNNYRLYIEFLAYFILGYSIIQFILSEYNFYRLALSSRSLEILLPSGMFIVAIVILFYKKINYLILQCTIIIFSLIQIIGNSRGAFLSAIILSILLTNKGRALIINKNTLYLIPIISIGIIVFFINIEGIKDFNFSLLTGRAGIWKFWIETLLIDYKYFLFGFGDLKYNSIVNIISLKYNLHDNWLFISNPHNLLVGELIRTGIVGVFILLIGYIYYVKSNKINLDSYCASSIFISSILFQFYGGNNILNFEIYNYYTYISLSLMFIDKKVNNKT